MKTIINFMEDKIMTIMMCVLLAVAFIMSYKLMEGTAIDNAIENFITESNKELGREVRIIMLTNKA